MRSTSSNIQNKQHNMLLHFFLIAVPITKIVSFLHIPSFISPNTVLIQNNNQIFNIFTTHSDLSSSLAYQDERYSLHKRSRNNNNNSLEKRLRDVYRQDQKKRTERRQSFVKVVHTLEEFNDMLMHEQDSILIVRFFANWCKACKATTPLYYSLARKLHDSSNISFVDVPITDKNVDLHQGLNIPSIPYGHIYVPDAGLVEQFRMTKKGAFRNHKVDAILSCYKQGFCNLIVDDDDDADMDYCSSPYCDIDDDDDMNTKLHG